MRINVTSWEQLGDSVCLTGAVRNVRAAHPEYTFEYTRYPQYAEVYANNPDFSAELDWSARRLETICYGPLEEERKASRGNHVEAMTVNLCLRLGIGIVPLVTHVPVINLTDEEIEWGGQFAGKWIINANCQRHSVSKLYPYWQMVVGLLSRIGVRCVRIGGGDRRDVMPDLDGVEDWRGRTTIRQLFAMAHGCDGILSPSSGIVHIGAVWSRRTVVVVGGRENPALMYGHCRTISTKCDARQYCYAEYPHDCPRYSNGCPCMAEIPPELVVDEVKKSLEG